MKPIPQNFWALHFVRVMVHATRLAVKFSPPTIALEYSENAFSSPRSAGKGDLKVVEVPLASANAKSTADALLGQIQASHPEFFNDKTVSLPQVQVLIA